MIEKMNKISATAEANIIAAKLTNKLNEVIEVVNGLTEITEEETKEVVKTLAELKEIATELGLEFNSKIKKSDLEKLIAENTEEDQE